MRASFISTVGILACLWAHAAANIFLNPFLELVQLGQSYNVSWTATDNYTYTIWLIYEKSSTNEYAWLRESSLAKGLHFDSLDVSYIWHVGQNLSAYRNYALWINGAEIPFEGESFSGQTEWFHITSSNIATTSSATASATTSGVPRQTSDSSPNNDHHSSLSGGAIAGIVIGCLAALALTGGGIFFFLWHRKRSNVKKREAAARASRLDPVMQESHSSYEMTGRTPRPV